MGIRCQPVGALLGQTSHRRGAEVVGRTGRLQITDFNMGLLKGRLMEHSNKHIMLTSDRNIRENLSAALENKGYQCSEPTAENYVRTGVNWGSAAPIKIQGSKETNAFL